MMVIWTHSLSNDMVAGSIWWTCKEVVFATDSVADDSTGVTEVVARADARRSVFIETHHKIKT